MVQTYKRPESVLVVIYCQTTQRYLMLQRNDDSDFWQSVTGSLEQGESPWQTAVREVREETGIDIEAEKLTLYDAQHQVTFTIFPQFLFRYAPGTTHNLEHWFYLVLPDERLVILSEHRDFCWLNSEQAMSLTKSWSNRQAIEQLSTGNYGITIAFHADA